MSKTIVLYPRSYNKRGEESKHSVIGITPEGNVVNVKLRLSEASSTHENPPSIAEFSRNDRKAKLACQADEGNSPENRFGVLLFSHCTYEGSDTGIETWIARWANVLAVDADSPDPIFGVGRISINTRTNGVLSAERNIERLKRDGLENSAECEKFKRQLVDRTQYQYSAVIFKYQKKETFHFFAKEMFLPVAEGFVNENTFEGITGGFFITIYGKDGSTTSQEVFSKYIMSIQRYQTGLEAAKSYLENHQSLLENCASFSIVPLMRINCGPRGNSHYGQSHKYQQICNLFYSDSGILVRNFVVRVSYFEDTKNTLLSRYYALDEHVVEASSYEPRKIAEVLPEKIDETLTPINYIMGCVFPLLDITSFPHRNEVGVHDSIQPDALAKDPAGAAPPPPPPPPPSAQPEPREVIVDEPVDDPIIADDSVADCGENLSDAGRLRLSGDVLPVDVDEQAPVIAEHTLVDGDQEIDLSNNDAGLFAGDSVVSGSGREIFDDFVNLILEDDQPLQAVETAPSMDVVSVAERILETESIIVSKDQETHPIEDQSPPGEVVFEIETGSVVEAAAAHGDTGMLEIPDVAESVEALTLMQDQPSAVEITTELVQSEVKPKLTGMAAFLSGREKAS
jgi:hypothetical protein